jgi:hypothetical protein
MFYHYKHTKIFPFILISLISTESNAELIGNGLSLPPLADIRINRETVTIGSGAIAIEDEIENQTDRKRDIQIAFPLPDFTKWDTYESAACMSHNDNFIDLKISENGKPVSLQLQQRATANSIDVTAELSKSDVPLFHCNPAIDARLKALSPATIADWIGKGILNEYGKPEWKLSSTYFWTTEFEPHEKKSISTSYRWISGGSLEDMLNIESKVYTEEEIKLFKEPYCISSQFIETMRKNVTEKESYGYSWLTYKPPQRMIGDFTVNVIRKGSQPLASFCRSDFGPTAKSEEKDKVISVNVKDYVPERAFHFVFMFMIEYAWK